MYRINYLKQPSTLLAFSRIASKRSVSFKKVAVLRSSELKRDGMRTGFFTQLAPRDLHLFDLDFSPLRIDHPEMLAMPNVTIHEGNSSSNLRKLSDHYFDWIYIDGDHELEGVEKDAAVALRKIKPDGILVFNDYTPWSILELSDYGVMPVVNSLCNQGWKIVYFALHRQMYCDIAIQRA